MPAWHRAAVAIGLAKCGAALVLAVTAIAHPQVEFAGRRALMLAIMLVFCASALALLAGNRRDRRAGLFGLVMLLEATPFADRMFDPFRNNTGVLFGSFNLLFAIRVDALAPYFMWSFVQEFPRVATFGASRTIMRAATRASLIVGIALIVLNAIVTLAAWQPLVDALSPFGRDHPGQLYWKLMFVLLLSAFAMLIVRTRAAPNSERRRVRLLGFGFVALITPPVAWALILPFWPAFARTFPVSRAGWIVYPLLMAAPIWAAYAVLVHQALDVRLVAVRSAVQYALQRQTVAALTMLPFGALLVQVWRQRDQRVSALFTSADGLTLAVLAVAGIVGMRWARQAFERIDRSFFREQYDARRILGQLVDQCRAATSRRQLGEVLQREIDRALHVESVHLLLLEPSPGLLVAADAQVRPLPVATRLVALARDADGPIDTQPDSSNPLVAQLPEDEQEWLVDHGCRLLVPLRDAGRRVAGLLILGEKKSELPYSHEDQLLLTTVAAAAALSLPHVSSDPVLRVPDVPTEPAAAYTEVAFECVNCGFLQPAGKPVCTRCGGHAEPSGVPVVVAGKFRIIERIGRGAMGVAYRGLDLHLDRPVAIKTLPRLQPDEAWRLRREARVIAAVSHPNLAVIYGSESWQRMPMLVLEFLSGGTLADRLARGAMPAAAAVAMGITLAEVIAAIHRAGILHRDIKPSNIGFTGDGTPKLLDFGIARLLGKSRREDSGEYEFRAAARTAAESAASERHVSTADGMLVGTPLYMSPEAVDGMTPEPAFDVWSVCVSLYESIAGVNPFQDASVQSVLRRICACDAPDLRSHVPGAPAQLAEFFTAAFSPQPRARPSTGDELRARLLGLRPAVARHSRANPAADR